MQTITRPLGFWAGPPRFRPFALGQRTVDDMERDLAAIAAETLNLYAGAELEEFQGKVQECQDLLDAVLYEDASTEPFEECLTARWDELRERRQFLQRMDVPPAPKEQRRATTQRVKQPGIPSWAWWAAGGVLAVAGLYAILK